MAIFFNTLGGSVSISIAQNIFSNTLLKQLPLDAPTVDPLTIVNAGATHIREVVTPRQLPVVLIAFDKAITTAFILPIVGCMFIESNDGVEERKGQEFDTGWCLRPTNGVLMMYRERSRDRNSCDSLDSLLRFADFWTKALNDNNDENA